MKMNRGKSTIEVSESMVQEFEKKGWVVDSGAVKLKPAKRDTVETPAVESAVDSEEGVNDEQKGD